MRYLSSVFQYASFDHMPIYEEIFLKIYYSGFQTLKLEIKSEINIRLINKIKIEITWPRAIKWNFLKLCSHIDR